MYNFIICITGQGRPPLFSKKSGNGKNGKKSGKTASGDNPICIRPGTHAIMPVLKTPKMIYKISKEWQKQS
jgi:hypothetical protein